NEAIYLRLPSAWPVAMLTLALVAISSCSASAPPSPAAVLPSAVEMPSLQPVPPSPTGPPSIGPTSATPNASPLPTVSSMAGTPSLPPIATTSVAPPELMGRWTTTLGTGEHWTPTINATSYTDTRPPNTVH